MSFPTQRHSDFFAHGDGGLLEEFQNSAEDLLQPMAESERGDVHKMLNNFQNKHKDIVATAPARLIKLR